MAEGAGEQETDDAKKLLRGFHCDCAHGAFSLAIRAAVATTKPQHLLWHDTNDELQEANKVTKGGGFSASIRLLDVQSLVVHKVFDLVYFFYAHQADHLPLHNVDVANWWDKCEPSCVEFSSDEVLDAILVARRFNLLWLLKMLEAQGHFEEFGCALWEGARSIWKNFPGVSYIASVQADSPSETFHALLEVMNEQKAKGTVDTKKLKTKLEEIKGLSVDGQPLDFSVDDAAVAAVSEFMQYTGEEEVFVLVQSWLGKILAEGDQHFNPTNFMRDGAHSLTEEGFRILLHSHELNTRRVPSTPKCGEYMVYEAVMTWCNTRYRRVMTRVKEENDHIAMQVHRE